MVHSVRAVAPVIGAVCLLAVTLVTSVGVGLAAVSFSPTEPTPVAAIDVSASDDGTVTLVHEHGATLSVEQVSVKINVNGDPIPHQPPVPFVGARGYRGAPSGPFNAADDGRWTAGETATLRLARVNAASFQPGATLTVEVNGAHGTIARVETTIN